MWQCKICGKEVRPMERYTREWNGGTFKICENCCEAWEQANEQQKKILLSQMFTVRGK